MAFFENPSDEKNTLIQAFVQQVTGLRNKASEIPERLYKHLIMLLWDSFVADLKLLNIKSKTILKCKKAIIKRLCKNERKALVQDLRNARIEAKSIPKSSEFFAEVKDLFKPPAIPTADTPPVSQNTG